MLSLAHRTPVTIAWSTPGAALLAGAALPSAGRDRRWIAGVTCGVVYLLLAPMSGLVTSISACAPDGIIASVAGGIVLVALRLRAR